MKVDFALLLYDEFEGAGIGDGNVAFRADGKCVTPLRKREGFYVFHGLDLPETELEIARPHYQKERRRIIKSCLDPGYPVVRIRLARAHPGNFSDCEWLHGSCPPNAEVLAYFEEEQMKLQIAEAGDRLTVLGHTSGSLVGRRYALNKESGETFLLTAMTSPGEYITDRPIPAPPRAPCPVMRAYLSKSGGDGRFHIPVEKGRCGKISATAFCNGEDNKWVLLS